MTAPPATVADAPSGAPTARQVRTHLRRARRRHHDHSLGDVLGDVSGRRGLVQGSETVTNTRVIKAFVPLSEMFGYTTDLRSMTQGRATSSMEFDHYQQVPSNIADEISKAKAS